MGNNTTEIYLDQLYEIYHPDLIILKANSSYIIANNEKGLCLFKLCPNSPLIFFEAEYGRTDTVEMHPNFKNVFLTTRETEMIIWEINENENKCEKKIILKDKCIKAYFCKNNDKQFITFPNNRTIKIWSMENSFCIGSLSVEKQIKNVEFFKDHLFFQDESGRIVIYDPVKLITKSEVKINNKNFFMIYEDYYKSNKYIYYDFIIFDDNSLILYNKSKQLNFKDKIEKIFYDNNSKIIYIFFINYLKIVNAKELEIEYEIKSTFIPKFYIDNEVNNKYICAKFFVRNNGIKIYSIISEQLYNPEKIKALTYPNRNFWDKLIPIISNIESLRWENNVQPPENDLVLKNYINDKEIKDEVFSNFNKSLKQKKLEVLNQIKDFHINENNLNTTYKDFIKLLIKDNTNKDLIIKYLKFLKENENKIDFPFIVRFEDEYNYYKIIFGKDELAMNKFGSKNFSEKELFIGFLDSILEIDINNSDFFDNIEKTLKNTQLFNQPITFDNQELYWYRNLFIIYTSLKKINDKKSEKERIDTLQLMKNCIKKVRKRKLFHKNYIINDKILLTSLVSLIALPQKDEYCDFNLNLIESKDPDMVQDESLNLNFISKNEKIEKIASPGLCLKNVALDSTLKIGLDTNELNNYNKMEKFFKGIIDIENVNKLLAKICCSNVMKEAFNILYPDYYKFPFNDESEALEFIKENFHYIPYKSYKTGGISEKFTLESYYFLQIRKIIFNSKNYNDDDKKLIKTVFYNGNAIKTNCHEMNHLLYDLLFLQSNGINEVETPRKNNIEISESGKNLERLLFKRVLYRMTLPECMFILNENNYNKSLEDFREDFNEINNCPSKIVENGIFSKFNSIYEIKDCNSLFLNAIMVSDDNYEEDEIKFENFFIDDIEDDSDVLGFLRV